MEIVAVVVGTILGFSLSELRMFFARKRVEDVHFRAIKAEVEFCSEIADIYLSSGIMAPLYRLPIVAFTSALPILLQNASVSDPELKAIQKFYMEVESLNRGLDQADLSRNDSQKLSIEYQRNLGKAQFLSAKSGPKGSYFAEVHQLLRERC